MFNIFNISPVLWVSWGTPNFPQNFNIFTIFNISGEMLKFWVFKVERL